MWEQEAQHTLRDVHTEVIHYPASQARLATMLLEYHIQLFTPKI